MASSVPLGSIQSFAGTSIIGAPYVASVALPTYTPVPVEAYAPTLGQVYPVDLMNGQQAPLSAAPFVVNVLIRAPDSMTDPIAAFTAVRTGFQALDSMAETGLLSVFIDTGGSRVITCQARRKPLVLTLAPKNARHLVVTLTFTILSSFV